MKTPSRIYFDKGSDVPNSRLPVLIYRGIFAPQVADKAAGFRQAFKQNVWTGMWTDTIYDYTHFHSNAHEVLGVAKGRITVKLGGENGRLFRLKAGDLLVLPAGVGHRRVGSDQGLKVVGAYPPGQSHFDMKRRGRAIPRVPLPPTDPFYGEEGPLLKIWTSAKKPNVPGRKRHPRRA
jgi:uncharacterized protein YjlB